MINVPPIQNQENLSTQEQLKNLRTYLYRLAQDVQMELNMLEKKMEERS